MPLFTEYAAKRKSNQEPNMNWSFNDKTRAQRFFEQNNIPHPKVYFLVKTHMQFNASSTLLEVYFPCFAVYSYLHRHLFSGSEIKATSYTKFYFNIPEG